MTRSAPLAFLALTLALASSLGCDDPRSLTCDGVPEIAGTATFEGQAHDFEQGSAVIWMAGTPEDPCIDFVEVTAQTATGVMAVVLRPAEGGGPMAVTHVGFGEHSAEDYGLYPEDVPNFSATFELEKSNDDCALASVEVAGTGARMYLEGSEDWGPYTLTDVNLSVSGTWTVEWQQNQACE